MLHVNKNETECYIPPPEVLATCSLCLPFTVPSRTGVQRNTATRPLEGGLNK